MLSYNNIMFGEEYHSEMTICVGVVHGFEPGLEKWLDRLIKGHCPEVDRIEHFPCNNDPNEDPIDVELDITVKGISPGFTELDVKKILSVAEQIRDDVLSTYVADGRLFVWITMYTEDILMLDWAKGVRSYTYYVDLDKFLSGVREVQ